MPHLEVEIYLPRPLAEVFAFFRQPANLLQLAPPELNMQLVEAPEQLDVGSRMVVKTHRWGIPQQLTSATTVCEAQVRLVHEQREGPFRQWLHAQQFEAIPEGTRVRERIDFEPPGGALGLLMTASFIERELEKMFEFRRRKLEELLGRLA